MAFPWRSPTAWKPWACLAGRRFDGFGGGGRIRRFAGGTVELPVHVHVDMFEKGKRMKRSYMTAVASFLAGAVFATVLMRAYGQQTPPATAPASAPAAEAGTASTLPPNQTGQNGNGAASRSADCGISAACAVAGKGDHGRGER